MLDPGGDFASVLARARGGDRAALDQLAREYEPKLRLVARVLLGPALRPYLDSVDLVQSVHRSLLLGLRDQKFVLETPENLLALALTLVRRKVARHWRSLQRQKRLSSGASATPDLAQLITTLSRPQDDPARTSGLPAAGDPAQTTDLPAAPGTDTQVGVSWTRDSPA